MQEKVARAICCAEFGMDQGWDTARIADSASCDCVAWKDHLVSADRALAALSVPTDEMFKEAMPYMDSWSSNGAWWCAMIAAAKDGK